ncbi:MAG: Cysteine desulfurase NifS [Chlamydiae bacterium]|nr:Cysteine desulfurase NifS [Chlamydiota bacterium]
MNERIYLDNNATTALDPKVFEAMCFDLCQLPRNPSAIHSFGQEARNELTRARRGLASSLGVLPDEILFSSGASESNNYLLRGFFEKIFPKKVITTQVEHSSILKNVQNYEKSGGRVTFLPIDERGAPQVEDLEKEIDAETGLIVVMAANNETGVKTDIEAFAKLAKEHSVPLCVDGVALMGKEPVKILDGITAMSFSAHKFHGPKGVGFAFLSSEYELSPLIIGGGQENGRRAGTQNLSGILGLCKAVELLGTLLPTETKRMEALRDYFEAELKRQLKGIFINGTDARVCNTSSIAFEGIDGESLLMALDLKGLACSHGSACISGSVAPSRVLSEMGLKLDRVNASIRFAMSRMTTQNEVERAIQIIVQSVNEIRELG